MPPTAGQTHDIVLDNQGYMLAVQGKANTVKYTKAAPKPGAAGLLSVLTGNNESLNGVKPGRQLTPFKRLFWDNWTGLGQRLVSNFDTARKSGRVQNLVALRPVLDGQALALAPQGITAQVDSSAATYTSFASAATGTTQIIAVDKKLFVSASPGANNSVFTLKATVAANIMYPMGKY